MLSPTTSAASATIDVRAHALLGRQADEARLNAIAEFDAEEEREFWRPYQARIEAKKRERLIRLNEFLATRGMEPEPLD